MKKAVITSVLLVLVSFILFAQESNNLVSLQLNKIVYVDIDTKELKFGMKGSFGYRDPDTNELVKVASGVSKSDLGGVEQLTKLTKLEKITFAWRGQGRSYSYLEKVPQLKVLVLDDSTPINWRFLEKLPNLEFLVIFYLEDGVTIDLKNNKNLKYLEIYGGRNRLTEYPILLNIPESLKYLNLSYTGISEIPKNMQNRAFITFLCRTNVPKDTNLPNLSFEVPNSVLPEEFIFESY